MTREPETQPERRTGQCEHVVALKLYLVEQAIGISSEQGEPDGWVNVFCGRCGRTYEIALPQPEDFEDDPLVDPREVPR